MRKIALFCLCGLMAASILTGCSGSADGNVNLGTVTLSEYKGVTVEILRNTPHVTDSGWIGPDHPSTATEEWGKEMLETTANYIVDFMEEFKKVKLS